MPLSSEGGLSDLLPAPEDVRRGALRLVRTDPVPSGLIRFPDVTGVRVVEVGGCCAEERRSCARLGERRRCLLLLACDEDGR